MSVNETEKNMDTFEEVIDECYDYTYQVGMDYSVSE